MDAKTRGDVVKMISDGHSNAAIRDALGVTLNQVAGVRCRDFPRRMTRKKALTLGMRQQVVRAKVRDRVLLSLIPNGPATTRQLAALFGDDTVGLSRTLRSLKRLAIGGKVVCVGIGPGTRWLVA